VKILDSINHVACGQPVTSPSNSANESSISLDRIGTISVINLDMRSEKTILL
jgi:hypothetical protein